MRSHLPQLNRQAMACPSHIWSIRNPIRLRWPMLIRLSGVPLAGIVTPISGVMMPLCSSVPDPQPLSAERTHLFKPTGSVPSPAAKLAHIPSLLRQLAPRLPRRSERRRSPPDERKMTSKKRKPRRKKTLTWNAWIRVQDKESADGKDKAGGSGTAS